MSKPIGLFVAMSMGSLLLAVCEPAGASQVKTSAQAAHETEIPYRACLAIYIRLGFTYEQAQRICQPL
jgi:hypothetical protein